MRTYKSILFSTATALLLSACGNNAQTNVNHEEDTTQNQESYAAKGVAEYKHIKLTTDMSTLSDNEKLVIAEMIKAAEVMDNLFWKQALGDKDAFLSSIEDKDEKEFAIINYGPWDRLSGNKPFIDGYGEKPKGANFYPQDATAEEIKALADGDALYTIVRRGENNELMVEPYHVHYKADLEVAANHLRKAAEITEDEQLALYLNARADALLTDNFDPSDKQWLGLDGNRLDIIIGPIETYEDELIGAKAAYEAYVLVKDMDWSERLKKYIAYLPELQKNIPVDEKYKSEQPGGNSQLNAYDVVYYAGHCNAGSKTIAVNLPNDEYIQKEFGTRRSQLKNAIRAKFDHIMVPIADMLIAEDQREHVTFDAFFENTMFHEVAHGLGIKNLVDKPEETVSSALGETHNALEEGKADILGLYMITYMHDQGILTDHDLMDNYVTFLAGIFRSVRFGASSAHGKANMVRFNYFKEMGAFSFDAEKGTYSVNMEKMKEAMNSLSELILTLQGNGDKAGVEKLLTEKGVIGEELQANLDRVAAANIPKDIVFEQGAAVLGLE